MYETIRYSEEGDTATLVVERPRINVKQLRELEKACDHLEDHSPARLLIVRGHSAGIDFADFDPAHPLDIHGFNKWEKLITRIERLNQATIAVVDGDCVGGGFQIVLACDVRIARSDVQFSLPEVGMGFLPGMATWRLARYTGIGHAKRLVLTNATLGAQEALRLGVLDAISDDLDEALRNARESLAPMHSVAISLARRLMLESFDTAYEDALGNFLAAQHRAVSQTAFLDTLAKERGTRR